MAPAPSSPHRVYIHTLGCPKNDADSRGVARLLRGQGIEVVNDPDDSTRVIVNTCGFIKDAKEESIAAILDACAEHGGERVLVTGCLVERYRDELQSGIPEVSAWFGLGEEPRLLELLLADRPSVREEPRAAVQPAAVRSGLPYAYVKISDGCDEPCTFCAIPSIKGPYYSLDTAAIQAEVDACLRDGAREIVLVGQDTAVWNSEGLDLVGLLALLAADDRLLRLRVMYLQPDHVSERLLTYMAGEPKLCRYLDIPLQHADREMLRRMGRRGDAAAYRSLLRQAREIMPDVSLRSTFIVGFPGETEARFETLLDFVDEIGFDHAGGFVYSPEEGTPGASLRPRVGKKKSLERLNRLNELITLRAEALHQALIGSVVDVMIDGLDPEEGVAAVGRTEGQAPDIDGVTYIEGEIPAGSAPGDIVRVTVTDAVGHDLIGRWDGA